MRRTAAGRALVLWPPIAVAAIFMLGWAVGKRSTPLDDWFRRFRHTPARWLLFFTDPWLLAITLLFGIAVALFLRRRRLAMVMVASPLVGIALANALKHLFGRRSSGTLAYPSGHTPAAVVVTAPGCFALDGEAGLDGVRRGVVVTGIILQSATLPTE